MNKAKSILKRSIAILLAMLTIMSVGLTNIIAVTVDMVDTGAYTTLAETGGFTSDGTTMIFLNTGGSDYWYQAGAWFKVELTTSSSSTSTYVMKVVDAAEGIFGVVVPSGTYTSAKFLRMNTQASSGTSWNDSTTSSLSSTNNMCVITGWGSNKVVSYTFSEKDHSNVTGDLLSVLKGEKIMFYIGKPSTYTGQNLALVNDNSTSSYFVKPNITIYDTNLYASVAYAIDSSITYSVTDNYGSWGGNEIAVPQAGGAYLANGTTDRDPYSVTATLAESSISNGTSTLSVNVTEPTAHFDSLFDAKMLYYISSDNGKNFSLMNTTADNVLDTSDLEVGDYIIYPVYFDGHIYTMGSTMPLTVENAACEVTVTETDDNGTVSINGEADGNTAVVDPDSNVTIGITPNTGYKVESVTGVSSGITYNSDGSATVTISNISDDTALTVTYKKLTYKIIFLDWDNNELDTLYVAYGDKPSLDNPTREGYTFTGWTPEIVTVTGDATYTAQYTINQYALNITDFDTTKATMTVDGTEVTTSGNYSNKFDYGTEITVVITPTDAYRLSVNGSPVESYSETFTMGVDGKTLALKYDIKTFDLTINQKDENGADKDGTVEVGNETFTSTDKVKTLNYDRYTINVTAPEHYYIYSVTGVEKPYTYTEGDEKKESSTFEVVLYSNVEVNITYAEMDKYELEVQQSGYVDSYTSGHKIMIDDDENGAVNSSPVQDHIFELYGGSHKIYVCAPFNHYIKSLTVGETLIDDSAIYFKNTGSTINFYEIEYTFNFSAPLTIEVEYAYNPTVTIDVVKDEETTNLAADTTGYGNSYSKVISATDGYYISAVEGLGDEYKPVTDKEYNYKSFTYTVDALTADVNGIVTFTMIPTYSLTIGEFSNGTLKDADGNTVEAGTTTGIYGGTEYTFTAIPNEGYYFTGWTVTGTTADTTEETITFTVTQDTTIKPNFAPATGTITFATGEGGEVTEAGTHSVTYPAIKTSVATADTASGYLFTGWTITGGDEGEEYQIYNGSLTSASISLRILKNGANITATAKFQDASKVTVYTYTDSKLSDLTLTQINSTGDAKVPFDGTQTSVTFGDTSWFTTGEITFESGYTDIVTADFIGTDPLDTTGKTGKLVVFNNTLNWETVYVIASDSNNMRHSDGGYTTANLKAIKMEQVPNTTYYYTYLSETKYLLFNEKSVGNYNNFNNGGFTFVYSDNGYTEEKPFIKEIGSSASDHDSTHYTTLTWEVKPSTDTSLSAYVTDAFYDENGNWIVENGEVWIYVKEDGSIVSSNRRALADYLVTGEVIETYNKGVNDEGWIDSQWDNFIEKYNAAVAGLGAASTTTEQANTFKTELENAIANLTTRSEYITLIGGLGAYTGSYSYFGNISFYTKDENGELTKITVDEKNDAMVDEKSSIKYYKTDSFKRGDTVIVRSTLNSDYSTDYIVYGWVVNGTDWVPATEDKTTGIFEGSYPCDRNATFIPVYFHRNAVDTTNTNIIKVYATLDKNEDAWGNYISAYTWFDGGYRPFGDWGGQVMIPDPSKPGTYYTFVEKTDPGVKKEGDPVLGITFNNYSGDVFSDRHFYQTYDYYEFVELADQGKDIITFQLNEKTTTENWPEGENFNVGDYDFENLVNYSGKLVDITGAELDQNSTDIGLYIVRTGPINPNDSTEDYDVGPGWANLGTSRYYVNAYIYKPDGTLVTRCKTYELKDFTKMLENRNVTTLNASDYEGKAVMVDYASLTDERRFDGEWFGVKSSETTVNISVQVALKNGTTVYQYDSNPEEPNINDTYGSGFINNAQSVDVKMGSKDNKLTASNVGNYAFVGWYLANDDDNDGIYRVDTTAKPLFNGDRVAENVEASGDAVYIAVFEELASGTFTVYNQYYSHSFFSETVSQYAPIPQSENSSYSDRYVEIVKVYDAANDTEVSGSAARELTKDSMTLDDITAGDIIEITVQTIPTRTNDYVYAWYLRADDAFGVNFEEIGSTDEMFGLDDKGGKEFTFRYTVKEGERSLTVYSDIVHYSSMVTLVYTYNNRYNQQRKYTVKYELSDKEIANDNTPSVDNINKYAPYVEDFYKDVSWDPTRVTNDGSLWTITAKENREYTVNINIDGVEYDPVYGEFNDAIGIYASDLNKKLTTVKGVWYEEVGEADGVYTRGTDKLVAYGNYLGLAITCDMNLVYTTDAELIYEIILDAPVYGREQDNSGTTVVDTIYADYLISYMLPHFHGDTITVNGQDKVLEQSTDRHTPVQVQTLRDAGFTVEYGIITEIINTDGEFNADGSKNAAYESYYGKDDHITKDNTSNELTLDCLKAVLDDSELDIDENGDRTGSGYAVGPGVSDADGNLMTYFYAYNAENISNKNRVLKTFKFENPTDFTTYYYNVYGYLVISDGTSTHYYISNVQTLSVDEALKQTYSTTTNS